MNKNKGVCGLHSYNKLKPNTQNKGLPFGEQIKKDTTL